MNTKASTFFWLAAIAILLLSLIASLHSSPSSITSSTVRRNISRIIGNEFFCKVGRKIGLDHIFCRVEGIIYKSHHHHHHHHHDGHHHRRKNKILCNESDTWSPNLISLYKISGVITVGAKGCANFSSVQKAIDAAPDFGRSWTLIKIDTGTYRYLSTPLLSFFLILRFINACHMYNIS